MDRFGVFLIGTVVFWGGPNLLDNFYDVPGWIYAVSLPAPILVSVLAANIFDI
jgi:hypothetical protein